MAMRTRPEAPAWANVRFANQPVLIHPLSGEEIDLGSLDDIAAKHIRTVSLEHFSDLIERDADGKPDLRLTYLAFWRFGPEPALVAPEIGDLWRVLPADTRVPDHSIWTHLDTVSALTGALADDAAGPAQHELRPRPGLHRPGPFDLRPVGGIAPAVVAGLGRSQGHLRSARA
jgi:hypothetical protein